jgi:hypothetical protein
MGQNVYTNIENLVLEARILYLGQLKKTGIADAITMLKLRLLDKGLIIYNFRNLKQIG